MPDQELIKRISELPPDFVEEARAAKVEGLTPADYDKILSSLRMGEAIETDLSQRLKNIGEIKRMEQVREALKLLFEIDGVKKPWKGTKLELNLLKVEKLAELSMREARTEPQKPKPGEILPRRALSQLAQQLVQHDDSVLHRKVRVRR